MKDNALTGGGLSNVELEWEKSAEAIVIVDTICEKHRGLTKQ